MYGTPYIFHFVHPFVKTAKIMVQRVNFERNLKNIRPPTVVLRTNHVKKITQGMLLKLAFCAHANKEGKRNVIQLVGLCWFVN